MPGGGGRDGNQTYMMEYIPSDWFRDSVDTLTPWLTNSKLAVFLSCHLNHGLRRSVEEDELFKQSLLQLHLSCLPHHKNISAKLQDPVHTRQLLKHNGPGDPVEELSDKFSNHQHHRHVQTYDALMHKRGKKDMRRQTSWQYSLGVCVVPMSGQKAQTGGADFITEYHHLYVVTLGIGWRESRWTLFHHPPLVWIYLWFSRNLLEFDGHGPEESQLFTLHVL